MIEPRTGRREGPKGKARWTDAHTVDVPRDGSDPSRVPPRRRARWPAGAGDAPPPGLDPGGPRRPARERRLTAAAGGGLMGSIEVVLTILVVALLWVAAVAFGRDSREDGERRSAGDPPLRL